MFRKVYSYLPDSLREKIRLFRLKRKNLGKPPKEPINVEKTIVVLGMHRSGTSLTANVLSEFGIDVGKKLEESGDNAESGFLENEEFIDMNDKILTLAGGSWDNPPRYEKIIALNKNKNLMNEIESLVRDQEKKIWAWKDPRTTLTIELYLPFLRNPHFIFCQREPLAIAKSLKKRNNFSIEKGLRITAIYNNRLNRFFEKIKLPKINLNYEEYFENPTKKIKEIGKFLKINKKVSKILVDKKMKHF